MDKQLKGKKVAILVTDGYEESELLEPQKALDKSGATTVIISPKTGEFIQGMKHDEKAGSIRIDLPLDLVDHEKFDAVLLPGGALNADQLRMDSQAQDFIHHMNQSGKPIAVICHAPWLLVSSGLVRGRIMTSYYTIQDDITNAGARWIDREVVRDRNWVSSRQPGDIPVFNREMIKLFAESYQPAHTFAA